VVPWLAIVALCGAVLVAVGIGVAVLARRRFPLEAGRSPVP
jgi:hypothetical protein